MRHRILPLALMCFLFLSPPTSAQDAPSLAELQARYERLNGLRAAFIQITTSEFAGDSTRIDGRVLLQGNKYRVETPGQTVVTNGETTWIYSPADSQVVVNNADRSGSTITPQTFLTTSAEAYEVTATKTTRRNGALHDVLSLTATADTTRFRKATLWVRRTDRIVTRLRATDRNGATLDLRLHDIVVNPAFKDTPFTFSPPEGAEVVDLRRNSGE
ncbi:MAG: outer membrane lipoprotein carrier protein LolA [Salinibacter sp.]